MDKYAGIERAASNVHSNAVKVVDKRKRKVSALWRWLAVAVCVGLLFAGRASKIAVLQPIIDAVKSIVCYDMSGHDDLGTLPAFEQSEEEAV